MKVKTILTALILSAVTAFASAPPLNVPGAVRIVFISQIINPPMNGHGHPAPAHAPEVYIAGWTLYFTDGGDFDLTLEDGNGNVEYTTYVADTCTQLVLPSDLYGEYTLTLTKGNRQYIADILIVEVES